MTRRRSVLSAFVTSASLAAIGASASPSYAQVVPPHAATTAPATSPFLNAVRTRLRLAKKSGALDLTDTCGSAAIPITISGEAPGRFDPTETAIVQILPTDGGEEFVDTVVRADAYEMRLIRTQGDPVKLHALVASEIADVLAHVPPGDPMQLERELNTMNARSERLLAVARRPRSSAVLDEEGRFTCRGLPNGWYDLLLTINRPVIAKGLAAQFSTFTLDRDRYLARIYVPKPRRGTTLTIRPGPFRKIAAVDRNAH